MAQPHHQSAGGHPAGLLVQRSSDHADRFSSRRRNKDPRRTAGQNLRPFAIAAIASIMAWMMILIVTGFI